MVRTYLFQENIYPIFIRELLKYEEAIDTNNQKAINSILEHVIIDGSPLSEKKRSSLEFIKNNREKILEDIRIMKNDPHAQVHHPNSVTYPGKLRIIATALLSCEEQFRKKDFQNPDFRAIVKREVNEMSLNVGFRIRQLESYYADHYDRLLTLLDEIKAEKKSGAANKSEALSDEKKNEESEDASKASKQDGADDDKDKDLVEKDPESKNEDSPEDERSSEAEESADKKHRRTPTTQLQVKVKKLSSQEVREGVVISSSGDDRPTKIEEEESSIDMEADNAALAELKASDVDPEDDDDQEMVEKGTGTPMDVDSLKSDDKKSSKSTRNNEEPKENGISNGKKKQNDSSSSENSSDVVEVKEDTERSIKLENLEEDDLLEERVKSLEINEWGVGQMAWTLLNGIVYWPCIVTKDANSNQHITTQHIGGKTTTSVHVKFLGKRGVHQWVDKDLLLDNTDPDEAKNISNLLNNAIKEFQELLKMDIPGRIDEIAPKKRRACSQTVVSSQEPVSKKMKLEDGKS